MSSNEPTEGLSRRNLMFGRAAATAAVTLTARAAAKPAPSAADPVTIVLFMRGGWDGLSIVVPYDDSVYTGARTRTLLLPPTSTAPQHCVHLANGWHSHSGGSETTKNFGIPQAFADPNGAQKRLKTIYDAGDLCFVHASGVISNDVTRSHFDAMTQYEFGLDQARNNALPDGWIARALNEMQTGLQKSPKGIAIASLRPRSFVAAEKVAVTRTPATFSYPGGDAQEEAFVTNSFNRLIPADPLRIAWNDATDSFESLSNADIGNYGPDYPDTPLGDALHDIAALVNDPERRNCANQFELRIGHGDFGGWDTHGLQGPYFNTDPLTGTRMYDLMTELNEVLVAFHDDMANRQRDYVLVCCSEFGRRIQENMSAGTDHGKGGVMLVMSNRMTGGGKVYSTQFPALSLDEDVTTTTDYQKVFAEILEKFYGIAAPMGGGPHPVFPSYDKSSDPFFDFIT